MAHDDDDGPLRPTYNPERPPWIGLYSKRKYDKQLEWWAEPGVRDRALRAGRWNGNRKGFKEEIKDFYDPKVPDGTSISGPFGLDSTKNSNLTQKADQPGNLYDFQRKVMEGSLQYKNIMEKYKLSPEHPGLAVNPTLDGTSHKKMSNLGTGTLVPINTWFKFGPRFFDKPLNDGCFDKTLCAAKYAAIIMFPYTIFEIKATQSIKVKDMTGGRILLRYLKFLPFPMGLASTWALSICTISTIRNKDDVRNHLFVGPITGAFYASVKNNFTMGLIVAAIATVGGIGWQYARLSDKGLQGRAAPQMVSGWHGGPNHWKMLMQGDHEIPPYTF